MRFLIAPLLWMINGLYQLCHNYGVAIILFTLASKVILLPITVWVHLNSIKMVKMQPDLNYAKVKYFGDREKIAEVQSEIYKKYKYNPFLTIIPTVIQLFLLMGVIEVIKNGLGSETTRLLFCGFSLTAVPSKVGGLYLLAPFAAAASALIMCLSQNAKNVLQSEQSVWNQAITLIISVGLSLYLGFFVSMGVVLYWVFSNLFSVLQLFILNAVINPKKFIDYERLEDSRKKLAELNAIGKHKGKDRKTERELNKREKTDYKRFFSVVNKHLVFYSERNGYYKYYAGLIDYLLNKTNVVIHYITSDPEDGIFQKAADNSRIRAYYIGEKKLITLMMKMDADIVVMTMPDLDNYHIKRSYIRKDIEYIYIFHGMGSVNVGNRRGAVDHFDTIFCPSKKQEEEIKAQEEKYGLPKKNIVETGSFVLDDMIKSFSQVETDSDQRIVLIAPSWHEANIVDSCLDELMEQLIKTGYRIVVRPHPQHVRHNREKLEQLKARYADNNLVEIQLDFSDTSIVWKADVLLTDWSDISLEFAYCTHRPVLFINTPMKVMNPDYKDIDVVPILVELRNIIGQSVNINEINQINTVLENLIENKKMYEEAILKQMEKDIFNIGCSASFAGKYLVERMIQKKKDQQE